MSDELDFIPRFFVQFLLSGSLLAGAVWAVGKLLPRLAPGVRGALWWLVCARFAVGFMLAGIVSTFPPAFVTRFVVQVPPFWQTPAPEMRQAKTAEPRPLLSAPQTQTETPAPSAPSAPDAALATRGRPPRRPVLLPVLSQIIMQIWLIGVIGRVGLSAVCAARLRKRLKAARTLSGDETDAPARALWEAAQNATRSVHHFPVVPRLLLSPAPCDPLVTGFFRPVILMSEPDVSRLSPFELRLVVAHEIAHLQRGDLLWGLLPHLVSHLLWFWPPALWACREWVLSCEAACDARAARACNASASGYGELLLKLGTGHSSAPLFAALPVSASFRLMQRRIVMLHVPPLSPRRRIFAAFGVAASLALMMPFLFLQPRTGYGPPPFPPDPEMEWKVNRDTQKLWSTYPDAPQNLDFTHGLAGWEGGSRNKYYGYKIAVQKIKAPTNAPSGLLQGTNLRYKGLDAGELVQYIQPVAFRGKRIRISGWMKSKNVDGANCFVRVNSMALEKQWFGNPNTLVGTSDWTKTAFVIDIPPDADGLVFGVGMTSGKVWLHHFTLEVVDKTVPVSKDVIVSTSSPVPYVNFDNTQNRPHSRNPANLRFENGLAYWWNDNPVHNAGDNYEIRLDTQSGYVPGQTAALLQNKAADPAGYGTLAQTTNAENLRGKTVRLSAEIKTENAKDAKLWTSVQSPGNTDEKSDLVGFPYLPGWHHWEKDMEVPRDATSVSFGLSLTGTGKVWTKGFAFEIVGDAVSHNAGR